MNSLIHSLNLWGGRFADFAWPILWQSSLLIAVVLAFDFLLRRKVRAAVRYSLWFVVFVKLLLPPTLALPTGAAWWLRSRPAPMVIAHHMKVTTLNHNEPDAYVAPIEPVEPVKPPAPALSHEGWMLLVAGIFSAFLTGWVLLRWRQIAQCVRQTTTASDEINEMLSQAHRLTGLRRNVTLRVTSEAMSPAVCGLFRPVILLPQSLIEKLTASQIRAVLLHELIHVQRRDVWVNGAQTLLQIVYWWHPLLWIANARMRRVREEAVDDAVMCALNSEAEVYAPTLLEVAKLAFARPLASLGLVGILESRSALRHRIERLLNFTTPRRAGVSMVSVICLAAFTALAVPMGEPPARPAQTVSDDLGSEKLILYQARVNPDVFTRNLRARAEESMHATNDDLNVILAAIMDGFGVDCTGERAINFDSTTGEIITQNTSEAVTVVDEVVKELNLKNGERILNPPHGLKEVLIEGQFYLTKHDQLVKFQLTSESFHQGSGEMTPWREISPTDTASFQQQLKDQGLKPISSPRIQTAHGITAELSVGDGTNNIVLKCLPYIHDGIVTLTVLARTTGEYAPGGRNWPDIAGHTNCAIFSRLTIPSGGTGILSAQQAGADSDLVVTLTAKILEPATKKVPTPGNQSSSSAAAPTNLYTYTFRLDKDALTERLTTFAAEHNLKGLKNYSLLSLYLDGAGVYVSPSVYREEFGHADITFQATKEQLRKTAEALGLNWGAEQALNDGKWNEADKPREIVTALPSAATGEIHYDYVTNSAAQKSANANAKLVQDGKLLFQQGKLDEAEAKFQEVLATDSKNQAALYYLSLIKQAHVRENDATGGARPRNVPGPGARSDTIRVNDSGLKPPAPSAGTNRVFTNPQRQKIYQKLKDIQFDKIAFSNMPLSEVAKQLAVLTQRRDPSQEGLNFIIYHPGSSSGLPNSLPFDPATGQPLSQAPPDFDVGSVIVDLNPALRNVRLLEALEAITKSADHPISYSILDYGVEFSLRIPDQLRLHTRTFKVDAKAFWDAVGRAWTNSLSSTSQSYGLRYNDREADSHIELALVNFFKTLGIDLLPPRSVFFNDHQDTLTVRATDGDLEAVEKALNSLDTASSTPNNESVALSTRTFKLKTDTFFSNLKNEGPFPKELDPIASASESSPNDSPAHALIQDALLNYFQARRFDLKAPKSLFYNARLGTLTFKATEKELTTLESLIDYLNSSEGHEPVAQVTVKARFVQIDRQFFQILSTNGVGAPTNTSPNRILSEEQFEPILKMLQKRDHGDLLNEGEVTTLSGRQANFQVVDVKTIILNNTNKTPPFDTQTIPYGTTLDVIARVAKDNRTIALKAIPNVTEFLGYEDVKTGKLFKSPVDSTQVVVPKSRIRQTAMDTVISDCDTLFITDFGDEWISIRADGIQERKPFNNHSDKRLVVFVTTTIIDRSGNRLNRGRTSEKITPASVVTYNSPQVR